MTEGNEAGVLDADERRRNAITDWLERESIRQIIRNIRARSTQTQNGGHQSDEGM